MLNLIQHPANVGRGSVPKLVGHARNRQDGATAPDCLLDSKSSLE
jgi:hypothetical protein